MFSIVAINPTRRFHTTKLGTS